MTAVAESTLEVSRPAGVRRDRRGRLLRGYLHKSSNSLCGIKGYASLIAGGPQTAGRTSAWARKIIAEVERLENIYNSVQDMAFPEPTPGIERVDLALVIADALNAAARRNENLRVGPLPRMKGELLLPAGDLRQVLDAILDNSAQSRPDPVEVTLSLNASDQHLALAVEDDGPGMAPELLTQVIDPFITTRPGRLGIGLSRVDTIMDMHGLGWGLRSVPQVGTTVTLDIARYRNAGDRR